MMRWKLEDGTPIGEEELAEEITRVPRTRFWRLSHMVFLWPHDSEPGDMDEGGGFYDGFALEVIAIEGGVEWLVQPVGGGTEERILGAEPTGARAVRAALATMEAIVAERTATTEKGP